MVEAFQIKKLIQELRAIRGRHTELVTVYIPSGYDLNKIITHLAQEQGTASNIKDKTTRTNVIDSLERMIRHLRLFKQTPPNGLAIFSGNTASQEGKQDIKVWSVEPPTPLKMRMYRCDQTFVLEPLADMIISHEVYGMIVMDNREGMVGLLKGKSLIVIKEMTSNVPGKLQVGGFSQQRYARLREEACHEFYKRISAVANAEFLALGKNLKGIMVGGPGVTKNKFASGDYLNTELKNKIVSMQDLSYTGEFGLHELLDKSHEALAQEDIIKEKKIMQEFFEILAKTSEKIAYGETDARKAIELGAADRVLISEDHPTLEAIYELAAKTGAVVIIISLETQEGKQLKELGGIAAILRYRIS